LWKQSSCSPNVALHLQYPYPQIIALGILLCILAVLWTLALFVLKFYYGTDRVGCAAGGQVIDVKQLKHEQRLDKTSRKRRILRNWRVQTACLMASATFLPVSMLVLRLGLNPLIGSLDELQQINDQVDSLAYRGIFVATDLQQVYDNLQSLQKSDLLSEQITDEQFCPSLVNYSKLPSTEAATNATNKNATAAVDYATLQNLLPSTLQQRVLLALDSVDQVLISYDLQSVTSGLYQVTNSTDAVDTGIDSLYSHDWIVKLLVVVMDVVVVFLFLGVLITKENTDYPAYQTFASWILLPIFGTILFAAVAGTCIFLSLAMLNAGTYT
jgi:hypothetical protein